MEILAKLVRLTEQAVQNAMERLRTSRPQAWERMAGRKVELCRHSGPVMTFARLL